MKPIVIEIMGLRLVSESNQHEHWMARARRKKLHTEAARAHVLSRVLGVRRMNFHPAWSVVAELPLKITLTRIGAKRIDPGNIEGSFKGVQDGIALAIKVDDGDPRLTWQYEQECVKQARGTGTYGVRIRIEAREEVAKPAEGAGR